jgi:ribosomal protein L7/L12
MKTERQFRIEQLKQELRDLMWEEAEEMALSTKARRQNAVQEILKLWKGGPHVSAIKAYRSEFDCTLIEARRAIVQLLEEQK